MSPIISFAIASSILFFIGIDAQLDDCEFFGNVGGEQYCLDRINFRACCRWDGQNCVENFQCLSSTTTTLPPFQTTEEAQETTEEPDDPTERPKKNKNKRQRKNVKPTRKSYPKMRKARCCAFL